MATVTGLTAARMEAIEAQCIIDGGVDMSGHLILTKFDDSTIDAGSVIGPTGADGVGVGVNDPVVDELPLSPEDGDICWFLADEDAGVVWQLKYRDASLSSYGWEFVGGSDLKAIGIASQSPTTTGVFTDLPTPIAVTLPLEGDYKIQIHSTVIPPRQSGQGLYLQAYSTVDSDTLAVLATTNPSTANTMGIPGSTVRFPEGVSAGSVKLQYLIGVNDTASIENTSLIVTPIRVG